MKCIHCGCESGTSPMCPLCAGKEEAPPWRLPGNWFFAHGVLFKKINELEQRIAALENGEAAQE